MIVENWIWYLLIGTNAFSLLCVIVLFCCLVRVLRLKRLEDDLCEDFRKLLFSIRSGEDGLGSVNKSMLFTNYILTRLEAPSPTSLQVDNRLEEEAIERKCCIPFTKDKLEALNELLLFSMNEMMSINTKDRFQNILDEEQREALHEKMDFCALMLKELRHSSKDTQQMLFS